MNKEIGIRHVKKGLLVICILFIGVGVIKAMIRPGPRQIRNREEHGKNFGSNLVTEREARTELIKKKLAELPIYTPPSYGNISPDQMEKYVKIRYYISGIEEENEKRRPKQFLPLGGALMLARLEMSLVMQTEVEQLWLFRMPRSEYEWLDKQVKKAMALTMKRINDNCDGAEKTEEFTNALKKAMIMGGYRKYDEQSNAIPNFDALDPSEIPEANYRAVVSYYKWLRYNRVDLKKYNFQCLMQRDHIEEAVFNPPQIIYPEVK